MSISLLTGLIGSIFLVSGAAWPEANKKTAPVKSIKNWLFFVGGLIMLVYAIMGWQEGAPFFYVILEIFAAITGILMMLNIPDKIDLPLTAISGIGLIIWSFFLFEDYSTIIFILGLTGIGLGYVAENGTVRRSLALTLGSILIALFSYLGASWIFFWLNTFFAIFSGYYLYLSLKPHGRN